MGWRNWSTDLMDCEDCELMLSDKWRKRRLYMYIREKEPSDWEFWLLRTCSIVVIDRFKVNWWRLRCWWWGRRVKVGYSTQSTDGLNSMALLVLTWLMLYCSFNNLPSLSLSLFHVLDNFTFETQKIITHVISIYSTYSTFSPYCPPPPKKKQTNQPEARSESNEGLICCDEVKVL